MTTASRALLRGDVMQAEGLRLKPYRDTVGKLTIGYGRNLDDVGISTLEAEVLLDHDLADCELVCRREFAWFSDLCERRQRVVVEMVFNLGLTGFKGFHNTIAAIASGEYLDASRRMLQSKWSRQVKGRALRLASMMRDGERVDPR